MGRNYLENYVQYKGKKYKLTKGLALNLNNKEINEITEIKGLENLTNLQRLNLRSNNITEIKGLENLKNLVHLDLCFNQISEIKGLENLNKLILLNLENNQISEINGLENLTHLNYLYLNGNNISLETFDYIGEGFSIFEYVKNPYNYVEYCRKLKEQKVMEKKLDISIEFQARNFALNIINTLLNKENPTKKDIKYFGKTVEIMLKNLEQDVRILCMKFIDDVIQNNDIKTFPRLKKYLKVGLKTVWSALNLMF